MALEGPKPSNRGRGGSDSVSRLEMLTAVCDEGDAKGNPCLDRLSIHGSLILPKLHGSVGVISGEVELVIPVRAKVTSGLSEGALAVGVGITVRLHHHIKLRFVLLEGSRNESEKGVTLCRGIVAEPRSVNVDVKPAIVVHGRAHGRKGSIDRIDLSERFGIVGKGGRDDFPAAVDATILNDLPIGTGGMVVAFRVTLETRLRHASAHIEVTDSDILDFEAKLEGHGSLSLLAGFIIADCEEESRIFFRLPPLFHGADSLTTNPLYTLF